MIKVDTSVRLCLECRTIDASFPLVPDCKSCAEMISHDEYMFWNTPITWEDDIDFASEDMLHSAVQRFKAFFDLITLS